MPGLYSASMSVGWCGSFLRHVLWQQCAQQPCKRPACSSHSTCRACGTACSCCVQTHNPNWQEIVWDAAAVLKLVQEDFPWFLPTYVSYPKLVQRSDVTRYMVLYKYGGVYLDADVGSTVCGEPAVVASATAARSSSTCQGQWEQQRAAQKCTQCSNCSACTGPGYMLEKAAAQRAFLSSTSLMPLFNWAVHVLM